MNALGSPRPMLLLACVLSVLAGGCRSRDSETLLEADAPVMVLDQARLVDLTYAYDATSNAAGDTRVDAPVRLVEGAWTTAEIPLEQLVGPAAVVDISDSVAWNPDYRLTLDDLTAWERRNGMIPGGAILLVRTEWGKNRPDPDRYFGIETPGDPGTRHFPGISEEAALFLTRERFIDAVGVDTPALDAGVADGFPAQRVFAEASIPGFRNVANLRHLPETGAWVMALPAKLAGGTEGPLRIVGILPPEPPQP